MPVYYQKGKIANILVMDSCHTSHTNKESVPQIKLKEEDTKGDKKEANVHKTMPRRCRPISFFLLQQYDLMKVLGWIALSGIEITDEDHLLSICVNFFGCFEMSRVRFGDPSPALCPIHLKRVLPRYLTARISHATKYQQTWDMEVGCICLIVAHHKKKTREKVIIFPVHNLLRTRDTSQVGFRM